MSVVFLELLDGRSCMTALNKILAILFQACVWLSFFLSFLFFLVLAFFYLSIFSFFFFFSSAFLNFIFTKLRVATKNIILNDIFRRLIIFSTCDPDSFGFFFFFTMYE